MSAANVAVNCVHLFAVELVSRLRRTHQPCVHVHTLMCIHGSETHAKQKPVTTHIILFRNKAEVKSPAARCRPTLQILCVSLTSG